jgi:hypothetical protein
MTHVKLASQQVHNMSAGVLPGNDDDDDDDDQIFCLDKDDCMFTT